MPFVVDEEVPTILSSGTLRRWAHECRRRPSPLLGALLATRYRREIRYRRPPAAKGSSSCRSPRSRDDAAWSAQWIATSI
jgi:hypothetical protein